MDKRLVLLILTAVLIICPRAEAIPPPWEIEEQKAGADLILIAKMTKALPVRNIPGAHSKIGIEPLGVLKGQLPETGKGPGGTPQLYLLYSRPPVPQGGIRGHVVGGPGTPQPREGETALLFLKRSPAKQGYSTVVLGRFGYVRLSAETKEDQATVEQTVERYRQWSAKIQNAAVRQTMDGYYRKAAAFARKQVNRPR